MQKKTVALFLSIALLVVSALPVGAVPSVDSVKKEREKTQGSLNSISQQIKGLESGRAEVTNEIEIMNTELVDILTSIGVCQSEIEIKEREIEDASEKLVIAEQNEYSQYQSMKKRVQFLYEKGDKAYMQALIESNGYSDLVNKADYVEKLYSYDHELLEEYIGVKQEVSDLKELLEEEEAGLEASRYELGQEQSRLETLITEKKQTVEDFDQQLATARKTAANMQRQLEQQTAQIKALEEAKKKEQEEKLRKKQEEAKKLAAAKKAAEDGTTQTVGGAGEVLTDKSYQIDSSDYETSATSLSAGAGAEVVGSSAGSSKGQSVIDYACQFVGNPYVYGGTSLTNGTDCSGFTQSVYAHFGISLPRDSTSQRSAGVGVSYDQAQPGDIICYAGHVALYMGGGMIVHASTERTGITYSPATYRTIITIRRVL